MVLALNVARSKRIQVANGTAQAVETRAAPAITHSTSSMDSSRVFQITRMDEMRSD